MPTRRAKPSRSKLHRKSAASGARLGDDRQAGADGALGVVLERLVGAEHGEQAVAGVLQDAPLMGVNDRRQAFEGGVHHRVDVFGVEPLTQLRRADDVHEQHGGGLQLLRRALAVAPGRELLLQRGDRHGDDGIAEKRALSLQCSDGRFDLLAVCSTIPVIRLRRNQALLML